MHKLQERVHSRSVHDSVYRFIYNVVVCVCDIIQPYLTYDREQFLFLVYTDTRGTRALKIRANL